MYSICLVHYPRGDFHADQNSTTDAAIKVNAIVLSIHHDTKNKYPKHDKLCDKWLTILFKKMSCKCDDMLVIPY